MRREGTDPEEVPDGMTEEADGMSERNERKRRHSQNNRLLREIMERLREYELDEVVIICNKFRARRGLPPLDPAVLESFAARW